MSEFKMRTETSFRMKVHIKVSNEAPGRRVCSKKNAENIRDILY
jgi:hypothetical protein